jgi:DMSO/TMAO reductase YedYZ molybdopterin-dependent catalytic subunit
MRHFSIPLKITMAVLFAACCVFSQNPATVAVRGDVVKPHQWSMEELKQQFSKDVQTIKIPSGKEQAQQTGTGIPLLSLIQAASLKVETTPKHYDLTFLAVVEAHDSYRVFFSLAELLPQCGNAQAWLIWDMDGKPLSGKEAPLRLIVLSDRGHDRQIYGIASITLVDGTKLAARL